MKRCYKCKELKDAAAFAKNSKRYDGLQTICRECKKILDTLYYKNHSLQMRKQIRDAKKKRIRNIQQQLYTYLSLHPCIDCGEKNIIVLEFDHQRDKENTISIMINAGAGWENILKEIAKCEVRCANCHRIKTAKQRKWYKFESLAQR